MKGITGREIKIEQIILFATLSIGNSRPGVRPIKDVGTLPCEATTVKMTDEEKHSFDKLVEEMVAILDGFTPELLREGVDCQSPRPKGRSL